MNRIGLSGFEGITLEQMNGIRLMRRIDRKYVFPEDRLSALLSALEQDYFVQQIDSQMVFNYQTVYYDTPDYQMYAAHQNGKLNRIKVRTREYVDSHLCFLEVKMKSNKGVTQKVRIENGQPDEINDEQSESFLASNIPYDPLLLEPKLSTGYKRITLVNKAKNERVTIDLDLCFRNMHTGRSVSLPQMVIVEIKKEQASFSPIMNALNALRIKSSGLSKYCLGVALTEDSTVIKINNIKPRLHAIHKITSITYE